MKRETRWQLYLRDKIENNKALLRGHEQCLSASHPASLHGHVSGIIKIYKSKELSCTDQQ